MRDQAAPSTPSFEPSDANLFSIPPSSRVVIAAEPPPASEVEETAAAQILSALQAAGVDAYFGVPGVPVVVVTAGPGATNVVTGVVNAHVERVPMVVICGDVAWAASGGVVLQSLGREGVGIEEMLKNVTRAAVRVSASRSAASQALAAHRAATNAHNPGPALLVLPIDCGSQT